MVGIELKRSQHIWSIDDSLEELALLAETAGAKVVGTVTQKLDRISPSHLIGKGKLEELIELKDELEKKKTLHSKALKTKKCPRPSIC